MGEAVSVNIGGRDIIARIVGDAVSVNTGGRKYRRKECGGSSICEHGRGAIAARIVREAVSVNTGGRDITARIVGDKVQIEERQM